MSFNSISNLKINPKMSRNAPTGRPLAQLGRANFLDGRAAEPAKMFLTPGPALKQARSDGFGPFLLDRQRNKENSGRVA